MAAIQTKQQREVLIRYARGQDITLIVAEAGLQHDFVAGTVSQLAGFDRGRARRLVAEHDGHAAAVAAPAPPARPPAAPRRPAKRTPPAPPVEDNQERERVLDVVAEVSTKHAVEARTELAELRGDPPPVSDAVDALLDRAAASFDAECRRLGKRVRNDLASLRARLAEVAEEQAAHDREAAARAEALANIERLRNELAAAEAELARASGRSAAKSKAATDVDPKAVRAWAKEAGLACPSHGRVPQGVVNAWKAAHPATAGSPQGSST
jgi:hypothetical protein